MSDLLGGVGLPKGHKKVTKTMSLGPKAKKKLVRENKIKRTGKP